MSGVWGYHLNDRFRQFVDQAQGTSAKPDKLAAYRRQVPSDPVEHGPGNVGISSRWWYLPGMYKPAAHCTWCTDTVVWNVLMEICIGAWCM